MAVCYLGVGSNLGNRKENIRKAIAQLNKLKSVKIIRISKVRQTDPVGGPTGQNKFLNAVLKIKTNLSAVTLLKELKNIENLLGRKKTVRFGPRVIDLDILLFGCDIINRKGLKVPHPRMLERKFVLEPLAEVL